MDEAWINLRSYLARTPAAGQAAKKKRKPKPKKKKPGKKSGYGYMARGMDTTE